MKQYEARFVSVNGKLVLTHHYIQYAHIVVLLLLATQYTVNVGENIILNSFHCAMLHSMLSPALYNVTVLL